MKPNCFSFFAVAAMTVALALGLGPSVNAQQATQKAGAKPAKADKPSKPAFCIMPPGPPPYGSRCFKELIQHPEQWKELRGKIDSFGTCAPVQEFYSEQELRKLAQMLKEANIKFCLEVGAVKEWAATGKACFDAQWGAHVKNSWQNLEKYGFKLDIIAMDEPLTNTRGISKKSDEYAIQETAGFVAEVRKHYPDAKIYNIEAYPTLRPKDVIPFMDAVQAKLKEMGVRPMDGLRIDADWTHAIIGQHFDWKEVKEMEDACRERGLVFSLVYWAAPIDFFHAMGVADDLTWHVSIMGMAAAYAAIGGAPDEYCIESWVGMPIAGVPENGSYLPSKPGDPLVHNWSFARSALEFYNHFVQPKTDKSNKPSPRR